MTPVEVEVEVARQRAELLAIEQARTDQIARAYSTLQARLHRNAQRLAKEIEEAHRAGIEVRPGWLRTQARYVQLIQDLEEHTAAFLQRATSIVTSGQKAAVQRAVEDGRRLARLALGAAPQNVIAGVTTAWDRLPAPALDYMIGRASDGSALGDLLNELAPQNPRRVADALNYGVAAGKNPRVIAREVESAANLTRHRSLVIARTEIVSAHRNSVTETWKQTGVVTRWRWSSAKDRRTCPACWAMDGTEHDADEPMGSHAQCRCARTPITPSWEELGFHGIPDRRPILPTGADVFDRLDQSDKLAILGRKRLDAYNAGDLTLADMVEPTRSDRWGEGIRVKALT